MNKKNILTLYKNEMLSILRDKKTVFMNVFIPIILYPLITIIASQVVISVQSSLKEQTYQIAIVADSDVQKKVQDILSATIGEKKETNPKNTQPSASPRLPKKNAEGSEIDNKLNIEILQVEDPIAALKEKEIDAFIEAKQTGATNGKLTYEIHHITSNVNSATVASHIKEKLGEYQEELRIEKLKELGVDYSSIWNPIQIESIDHTTKEQSIGTVLGGIIPLMIIMGLVNGATHTAVDTTAGEKERGTLETTFSFPVSRKEIITSKFAAVATMASFSVLLNFLSLGVLGWYMMSLIKKLAADNVPSIRLIEFLPATLIMILSVILFAIFISALLLAIFSTAQNPKEANLYSVPIVLISIMMSYMGFIPNLELSLYTSIVPIVNITMLIKSILIFEYNIGLIFLVLISNLAYGFLAIAMMYKVFEKEDMLFGENTKFFSIFESRANLKPGGLPSISEAILVLTVGFMLLIFVGSYFQVQFGFWGLLSIQISIVLLSIGYALYAKFNLKKMLAIRIPQPRHIIGSVFLWIGTLFIVLILSAGLQKLFPQSMDAIEALEEIFKGKSLLALLLVVALAPAICEEIFFRGFIFSAFEKKLKPFAAMLIVSVFFGIYHMSLVKFFTTAILGFALNYSMYKSKSIFTSGLMHFLNNGISVILLYYQDRLLELSKMQNINPQMNEADMLAQAGPVVIAAFIMLFLMAVGFIAIGVALLNTKQKRAHPGDTDPEKTTTI